MLRAIVLLILVVGLSALATWYFGRDVVIALGLILVQVKVLAKKLAMVEWPALLIWLKAQWVAFFRVELLKKWITSVAVPMVFGRALIRRIKLFLAGYLASVQQTYDSLMRWFAGLGPVEKALAWAIVLFATLALSVTSLGLWLVLFSVQLPFWLAAGAAGLAKAIWASTQKSLFKLLAFLQLSWLWRGMRRLLPRHWLEAKRRFDFRVARAVVRRRRMTVRQLAERKDRLPFRTGVLIEYLLLPPRRDG
ncbi:hypothetical protein [Thetidibacter halocola]|uniref:Uncharacterized protein n=1 Tax=Thetidibacter halocola TaxID=2827239 RepID=A0A8J7WJR5_9RHOB|nr:hypothetical protein [Thetidibacter halocola]MBS0126593.1 hypothetical protein [Thetidibacter halocola]